MQYSYINPGDDEINLKMNFSLMELKVIHNVILTMLDDAPEMVTYRNVVNKIQKNITGECNNCGFFYGVNDINTIDMWEAEWGYEVGVDLNVQSGTNPESEDMVLFFSPEQIDLMAKVNRKMKKDMKNNCK